MKIGTQNQAFFPENILEKFRYIKEMGFDGFEIDGKLLVNNLEEVKAAIKETGLTAVSYTHLRRGCTVPSSPGRPLLTVRQSVDR